MIKRYETTSPRNQVTMFLPFGQTSVKVEFEGGNASMGRKASYTTNDPFFQRVLEQDKNFGIVYRLAYSEAESEDEAQKAQKEQERIAKAQAAAQAAYAAAMAGNTAENGEADAAEAESTTAQENTEKKSSSQMKDMEFGDASEVIIYVMENFGEQTETFEEARKVLRKHKINPVVK